MTTPEETQAPDEPEAEAEAPDEPEAESEVRFRYLGDGSSNPSTIPARDLTDEDWEGFTEDQQASVLAHPQLYESTEEKSESESEESEAATEPAEHDSAKHLIAQAEAATTTAELDEIEAHAEGRTTVLNAVAGRRAEIA